MKMKTAAIDSEEFDSTIFKEENEKVNSKGKEQSASGEFERRSPAENCEKSFHEGDVDKEIQPHNGRKKSEKFMREGPPAFTDPLADSVKELNVHDVKSIEVCPNDKDTDPSSDQVATTEPSKEADITNSTGSHEVDDKDDTKENEFDVKITNLEKKFVKEAQRESISLNIISNCNRDDVPEEIPENADGTPKSQLTEASGISETKEKINRSKIDSLNKLTISVTPANFRGDTHCVEAAPSDEGVIQEMREQQERIIGAAKRKEEKEELKQLEERRALEVERKKEEEEAAALKRKKKDAVSLEEILSDIPLDEAKMDGHDVTEYEKSIETPISKMEKGFSPRSMSPNYNGGDEGASGNLLGNKLILEEDLEAEAQFQSIRTCGSFFCFNS
mmetsp:Transcript_18513/g.20620  ORF Transcript_18513/g.20620 Transcript_18513/m.20620 type:complete len:390 (-) Transcript_18513:156-1325(-)